MVSQKFQGTKVNTLTTSSLKKKKKKKKFKKEIKKIILFEH